MANKFCPMCGSDNTKQEGSELICLDCDRVFKISLDGARVVKRGVVKELTDRIEKLESIINGDDNTDTDTDGDTEVENKKNKDDF